MLADLSKSGWPNLMKPIAGLQVDRTATTVSENAKGMWEPSASNGAMPPKSTMTSVTAAGAVSTSALRATLLPYA